MKKTRHSSYSYLVIVFILTLLTLNKSFAQNVKSVGSPIDFANGNEYDPAFSNDGKLLAFISDKSGQFKLYLCKILDDNNWSEPEEFEKINNFNNGQGNIRYPSFNYDGSRIYFCADYYKDSSNVDIFYTEKINGSWSDPISLGPTINSLLYDGQPSISADNKTLYFARDKSNNKDDFDCKKILFSKTDDQGDWLAPEELPVPINIDCEQTPKIGIDNKTLYFSSVRDGGKGGFDVYKTRLIAKNVWVPAENLDTINTANNEFSPAFSFNNDEAFLEIQQIDKRNALSKIYKSNIPPQYLIGKNVKVTGKIIELPGKQAISADISVYNPVTSRLISKYTNNSSTGEYQLFLQNGSNYQIDFHKKGYSHTFVNVEAKKLRKNEDLVKNISLYKNVRLILNVFDDEIFRPINAQIEIKNSIGEVVNTKVKKLLDGRFKVEMPIGDEYEFFLNAEFYQSQSFKFNLKGIVQFDEFEKDAELKANKIDFEISISDDATQAGLPVEVLIKNLDNDEIIRTTATVGSDGKYIIKLRKGNRYNVSVSPKGYSFYNTTVDLKKKKAPKKLEVKLKQLKEDTKLTLNNITFEVNSADLNESSFSELDRVVKLILDNPSIKIEIAAHTDNSGSNAYNLRLSNRRANSVKTYLSEQNIITDRLISKGYGESSPLFPNTTDENKALNRRVELKIVKI